MIRHKILDVWVKEDNPASQEVVVLIISLVQIYLCVRFVS